MEEAIARGDSDSENETALADFEEFEAATLAALEAVHEDELDNLRRELIECEEPCNDGSSGGVYFARSDALVGCIKIGATRRHDPMLRVGELSRCVPIPFVLLFWIPTLKPFNLEARIHKFFATKRLRNKGAGTEFFAMTAAAIKQLPPALMAGGQSRDVGNLGVASSAVQQTLTPTQVEILEKLAEQNMLLAEQKRIICTLESAISDVAVDVTALLDFKNQRIDNLNDELEKISDERDDEILAHAITKGKLKKISDVREEERLAH